MHTYNAMKLLPFEGMKGFSLIVSGKHKEPHLEKHLKIHLKNCKHFCEVFLLAYRKPGEAIMKDPFLYNGITRFVQNLEKEKLNEIYQGLEKVLNTTDKILNGDQFPRGSQECYQILENLYKEIKNTIEPPISPWPKPGRLLYEPFKSGYSNKA